MTPSDSKTDYSVDTVLYLHHSGKHSKPFWRNPANRNVERLVVEVFAKRGDRQLYVYGVDPDQGEIVFSAVASDARMKQLLIDAIITGVAGRPITVRDDHCDTPVANDGRYPTETRHEVALASAGSAPMSARGDGGHEANTVVVSPGDPGPTGPKGGVVIGLAITTADAADKASAAT